MEYLYMSITIGGFVLLTITNIVLVIKLKHEIESHCESLTNINKVLDKLTHIKNTENELIALYRNYCNHKNLMSMSQWLPLDEEYEIVKAIYNRDLEEKKEVENYEYW